MSGPYKRRNLSNIGTGKLRAANNCGIQIINHNVEIVSKRKQCVCQVKCVF